MAERFYDDKESKQQNRMIHLKRCTVQRKLCLRNKLEAAGWKKLISRGWVYFITLNMKDVCEKRRCFFIYMCVCRCTNLERPFDLSQDLQQS